MPLLYVGMIVAIVVVGFAFTFATTGGSGKIPVQTPIMITGSASVPEGASAFMVSYSSVLLNYSYKNGTEGVAAAYGNGTVNLLSLANVSQVLANAQLGNNATVTRIRFTLDSANITINGTRYPVYITQNNISASVSGPEPLNGSSSILVDFIPSVQMLPDGNASTFTAYSMSATVAPGLSAVVGSRIFLSDSEKQYLNSTIGAGK